MSDTHELRDGQEGQAERDVRASRVDGRDPMRPLPSREELRAARAYLKALDVPADDFLMSLNDDYVRVSVLDGHVFGLGGDKLRALAESGDFPFSELPSRPAGWRFYVPGVVWYVAAMRGWRGAGVGEGDAQTRGA